MSFQALAFYALPLEATEPTETAVGHDLAMSPVAYGIVALCILMSLLLITFAFRNIGSRH